MRIIEHMCVVLLCGLLFRLLGGLGQPGVILGLVGEGDGVHARAFSNAADTAPRSLWMDLMVDIHSSLVMCLV